MGRALAFALFTLLLTCQDGGFIMDEKSGVETNQNPPAGPHRAGGGAVLEKSLPASPGGLLSVELDTGGTLAVSGWDRQEVAVTARRGGPDGRATEVELREASGGVVLTSRYTGPRQTHATSMSFDVKVPASFDVRVTSSGGSVRIVGLDGAFTGHTGGGDLTFSGASGRVELSTGSGTVTLTRSRLDGRVSTGGGDILFEGVRGSVEGHTGGGRVTRRDAADDGAGASPREGAASDDATEDEATRQGVTLEGVMQAGVLKVSKAGGRIEVADAPEGADLETGGGNIRVGSARRFVRAQTGGGDIHIEAVDGRVEATTGTGSVSVTMTGDPGGEGARDVFIATGNGDVTLSVPPGLSMEFDLRVAYTRADQPHRIESDFPLERRAPPEWSSAEGTPRCYVYGAGRIGGGHHHRIRIQTLNGDIHIRKGR